MPSDTHGTPHRDAPLWQQIEQALHTDILAGVFPPKSQLPSEQDLSERFAAHRHTVRRALAALAQKGMIRSERGRGSFVNGEVIGYRIGRKTRVEENLLQQNLTFSGRLISVRESEADSAAVDALGLRGKSPQVLIVETLNESDGVPISLVQHVMSRIRFTAFPDAYKNSGGSVTAALSACGVEDFARVHTRVSTRLPTKAEADLLQQPPVRPVLVSESIDAEPDGSPVKFAMAVFAGDRVRLALDT
jgi:GntR family transcriptional regulator, phosphonate transport system regulatory protein